MFDNPDKFLPASLDVCVVVAIAFSGHALKDVVFFQHGLIGGHLVAPATIGVEGAAVRAATGAFNGFF